MRMLVEYIGVSVARPILGRIKPRFVASVVPGAPDDLLSCRARGRYLAANTRHHRRRVAEACVAETEFSKAPVGHSAWIKETEMLRS